MVYVSLVFATDVPNSHAFSNSVFTRGHQLQCLERQYTGRKV